jgi:hypothetical protein
MELLNSVFGEKRNAYSTQEGYISFIFIVQDGKIYLSLLSIVELETLLTTTYEDYVSTCHLCKHIVIQVSTGS